MGGDGISYVLTSLSKDILSLSGKVMLSSIVYISKEGTQY